MNNDILDIESISKFKMAGFTLRLFALVIDAFIILIIYVLLSSGFIPFIGSIISGIFSIFAPYIIAILYHSILESSNLQGSFGKQALSIVVVSERGSRLNFSNSFGRNIGKILSMLILYIGFFMAIWTTKKQTLHDIMASTLVVKKSTVTVTI